MICFGTLITHPFDCTSANHISKPDLLNKNLTPHIDGNDVTFST